MKRNEDSLRDLQDSIKCTNICIIGVPEGEKKEKGPEKIFEHIISDNFSNMRKEAHTLVQEVQSPIEDEPNKEHDEIHISQTDKN